MSDLLKKLARKRELEKIRGKVREQLGLFGNGNGNGQREHKAEVAVLIRDLSQVADKPAAAPKATRKKATRKAAGGAQKLRPSDRAVLAVMNNAHVDRSPAAWFGSKKEKPIVKSLHARGLASIVKIDKSGPEGPAIWAKITSLGLAALNEPDRPAVLPNQVQHFDELVDRAVRSSGERHKEALEQLRKYLGRFPELSERLKQNEPALALEVHQPPIPEKWVEQQAGRRNKKKIAPPVDSFDTSGEAHRHATATGGRVFVINLPGYPTRYGVAPPSQDDQEFLEAIRYANKTWGDSQKKAIHLLAKALLKASDKTPTDTRSQWNLLIQKHAPGLVLPVAAEFVRLEGGSR